MAFFLRGAVLLYKKKDLKSKTPPFLLKEEIIKLSLCSSLRKKKLQRFNICFLNYPLNTCPHQVCPSLQLWKTSFVKDPCRSYSYVDISQAKRSLPSQYSEYTNAAFHICES